jgi:hypothetical protein
LLQYAQSLPNFTQMVGSMDDHADGTTNDSFVVPFGSVVDELLDTIVTLAQL